jgi:hypothetical protein
VAVEVGALHVRSSSSPSARRLHAARPARQPSVDLVERPFVADRPDALWVSDIERHEALLNRVEVGDLHRRVVVAAR